MPGVVMDHPSEVDALVGDRRQRIVSVVHERGRTVTIDELADVVAEWERERDLEADWEEIHQHLYEVDLPALDDAELLVFDKEEGVVNTRRTVVDGWPEDDKPAGRPWLTYLVGAAGVGVAVVAAVAGLRPDLPVSSLWPAWAAGTVVVLAAAFAVESLR